MEEKQRDDNTCKTNKKKRIWNINRQVYKKMQNLKLCLCFRNIFFLGEKGRKWSKMTIFRHVGNDLNVPLEVSSMHQTIKGDPRDGWDESKPDWSYFPPWYSKSGHFPIEIPIKNKKCLHNWGYGSIILKIVLWAHFTIRKAITRKDMI